MDCYSPEQDRYCAGSKIRELWASNTSTFLIRDSLDPLIAYLLSVPSGIDCGNEIEYTAQSFVPALLIYKYTSEPKTLNNNPSHQSH